MRVLAGVAGVAACVALASAPIDGRRAWFEWYFVGLALALFAASWRANGPAFAVPRRWQWLIFVAMLAWRLAKLHVMCVWLDEDSEWRASGDEFPVAAGASIHQPPLELAIMALARHFSTSSVTVLRLPMALASAAAATVFFRIAFRLLRRAPEAALCTVLFAANACVAQYGYEARPVSLALLAFVLTLEQLLPWLLDEATPPSSPLPIAVGAALSCLSIGLQPPFAFAALGAAFLAAGLPWRRYATAFGALAAGIAVYLPIQIVILMRAPPRLNKLGQLSLAALRAPNAFQVPLADYVMPLGAALIAVTVAAALDPTARRALRRRWPLAGAGLLFLFVLSAFFLVVVRHRLQQRYLVLAWPVLLLGMLALLADLRTRWRSALLVVPVAALALLGNSPAWRLGVMDDARVDVRSLYGEIDAHSTRPVALYAECIGSPGRFCGDILVAPEFYLHGDVDLQSPRTRQEWIRDLYLGKRTLAELDIVVWEWSAANFTVEDLPNGAELYEFRGVQLVRLRGADCRRLAVLLLEAARTRYERTHDDLSIVLYPALIWGHLALGERQAAESLWRAFEANRLADPEALPLLRETFEHLP